MDKEESIFKYLVSDPEFSYSIVDKDGKTLKVSRIGDRYFFNAVTKSYNDAILAFRARDDDVYVVSYPRSGTHWVFHIVQMLVSNTSEVPKHWFDRTMVDWGWTPPEVFDSLPSPRVTSSHRLVTELPEDAIRRRCKIVYVERNFKDVAVSWYHVVREVERYEYSGEWPAFCDLFLRGEVPFNSWFDFVKSWRKFILDHPDYPIYCITYEKLRENPEKEISQLANFLGCKPEPVLLSNILENTEFKKMKAEKQKDFEEMYKGMCFELSPPIMYRKGQAGCWKAQFTVAQSEMFDAEYKRKMGEDVA